MVVRSSSSILARPLPLPQHPQLRQLLLPLQLLLPPQPLLHLPPRLLLLPSLLSICLRACAKQAREMLLSLACDRHSTYPERL